MVVNEVHGGAYAIVQNSTVTGAASLAVTALNNASIDATLNATATASGSGSFDSGGTTLAINGSISINEILGDADAHIVDSTVRPPAATSTRWRIIPPTSKLQP